MEGEENVAPAPGFKLVNIGELGTKLACLEREYRRPLTMTRYAILEASTGDWMVFDSLIEKRIYGYPKQTCYKWVAQQYADQMNRYGWTNIANPETGT